MVRLVVRTGLYRIEARSSLTRSRAMTVVLEINAPNRIPKSNIVSETPAIAGMAIGLRRSLSLFSIRSTVLAFRAWESFTRTFRTESSGDSGCATCRVEKTADGDERLELPLARLAVN